MRISLTVSGPTTSAATPLPDHVKDALAASVLFPKRMGEPHDYAALAEFMIMTKYFNGESVRLDGDMRMAPR